MMTKNIGFGSSLAVKVLFFLFLILDVIFISKLNSNFDVLAFTCSDKGGVAGIGGNAVCASLGLCCADHGPDQSGSTWWSCVACGGGSGCGNAAGPACDGLCSGGETCGFNSDANTCSCKAPGCNGGFTDVCKRKSNCQPKTAQDGKCGVAVDGEEKDWCRVRTCTASATDKPTLASPTNGSSVSSRTVRLTWNQITNWGINCQGGQSNHYLVYVNGVSVASLPGDGTGQNWSGGLAWYDYTIPSTINPGSTIYWRITATNGCSSNNQNSPTWTFIFSGGITGNVYFDPANSCSAATLWNQGGTLIVKDQNGTTATVTNGGYILPESSGTYNLTLAGYSIGYACSTGCAQGCPSRSISSPSSNNNFFLTYNPGPWWQVKDSDISTAGSLTSQVPAGQFFGLAGAGGYPGVAAYAESTSLTNVTVSATGWLAQSTPVGAKTFDSQYFNNQIPAETSVDSISSLDQGVIDGNTTPSYGYYWYKYDGSSSGLNLNLDSALNIGSKKVVLLVNSADFYINAPINLTDGQGFFMVVVGKNADGNKGNIFIDSGVGGGSPDLEGVYVADGQVRTGTTGAKTDSPLTVRGSIVGYGGVDLQRDLANSIGNGGPAELFEYAPDQIMLFPSKLGFRKINWKEVAP